MQLSRAGPRFREILTRLLVIFAVLAAMTMSPGAAIAKASTPRIDTFFGTTDSGPPARISNDLSLAMTDVTLLTDSTRMHAGATAGLLHRRRCTIASPLDLGIRADSGSSPPLARLVNYPYKEDSLGRRPRSATHDLLTTPTSIRSTGATYDYGRAARMGRITPTRQNRGIT